MEIVEIEQLAEEILQKYPLAFHVWVFEAGVFSTDSEEERKEELVIALRGEIPDAEMLGFIAREFLEKLPADRVTLDISRKSTKEAVS